MIRSTSAASFSIIPEAVMQPQSKNIQIEATNFDKARVIIDPLPTTNRKSEPYTCRPYAACENMPLKLPATQKTS